MGASSTGVQGESAELVRGLGRWQATGVVISTIIGTGVFLVAAPMARATGSEALVLAAWLIGTVIALSGMLCFAELGAAFPQAGGMFAYFTRGLGPGWGFLFGWADSLLISPAGFATLAAGFVRFAGFLLPGLGTVELTFHAGHQAFALTAAQPLAAAAILVIVALNGLSINVGGGIQLVLAALKAAAILVIIFVAIWWAEPAGSDTLPVLRHAGGAWVRMLAALVPVMWAYNGFQMLGNLGGEIRHPARNIPRALIAGLLILSALYLLVNAAYFHVLSVSQVARSSDVASDAVRTVLGLRAARWLTVAMGLSALASLHGVVMEGARIPYAMTRGGLFFQFAGRVHPRFRSPIGALFLQGGLGALIALTGTFEQLFSFYVFMMWSFTALGAFTLIRLRVTAPELPRPYRVWGYPWTPLLFIVATLALTTSLWMEQPVRSTLGVLVTLSGLPLYFLWRRRRMPETGALATLE